jgi:hypothetical protein
MTYFPIEPDHLMGCDRLGHSWDEYGDCRHCPANQDDDAFRKGAAL